MARVYAVASAKGGVGKTTTVANLAATLAAAGYDIAVVDGDIGMANLGNQLGIEVTGPTLHDVLAGEASVAEASYEGPHGMTVVPGDTDLTAFSNADITKLGRVVGSFADRDYVFVDTGAGLSHETALPLGLVDEVVLVSTGDRDALGDTEKTRDLATRLGATVTGVVITRVTPGDTPSDASPLDAPILGSIPEDTALAAASDAGIPITVHDPDSPAAAAYRGVASELADGPVRPPETPDHGQAGSETDEANATESEAVAEDETDPAESETGAEDEASTTEPEPADEGEAESASETPVETRSGTAETDADAEPSGETTTQEGTDTESAGETTSEGSAEAAIDEAEGETDAGTGDEVPFAGSQDATMVEEQADDQESEDDDEKKGFLSRLFG